MADGVKASRRAYHSPLRADQAQRTRRRILESARRLFVDRGYARTTVAAVASDAGVSPETIYLTLGGKRGLLEGVMEITGPHDSVADDHSWWQMVAALPGASERLDGMAEYSCRILARTRPVHAIIRGAADKEPFAAELGRRLLTERLANQTERIRRYLGDALRPGLSPAEAGERYCALASPELYHLLTVELAWTADRHRSWLADLLHTDLLGSHRV
jgi:AcrR family transcriptional regulator